MDKPFEIGMKCIIMNSDLSEATILDGYIKKDGTWRLLLRYINQKGLDITIEKDINKVTLL